MLYTRLMNIQIMKLKYLYGQNFALLFHKLTNFWQLFSKLKVPK